MKTGYGSSSVVGGCDESGRAVIGDGGIGVPGLRVPPLLWLNEGDGGGKCSKEPLTPGERRRAEPGGEWFEKERFRCEGERERERREVVSKPCNGGADNVAAFTG